MSKLKTVDEFKDQLMEIKPDIEVVGEYYGNHKHISCRCKKCNHEWNAIPCNLLNKASVGCPKCASIARGIKKTETYHKKFRDRLLKINENIEIVGLLKKAKDHIDVRCKICGHEWAPTQDSLLQGKGCPECSVKKAAKSRMMSTEEFVNRCNKTSPYVEVLGEYNGVKNYINVVCKKCGFYYSTIADNLLQGSGCPICNMSKGERKVASLLDKYHIDFDQQHTFLECRNRRVLPFDFYLPDYNICIEYDGEQHFKPIDHFGGQEYFVKRQENDSIKTNFCQENDIGLVRIPYYMSNELEDILFEELNIIDYLIDTSPLDYAFEDDFLL